MQRLKFKKRVIKNGSNKHIFDPIKNEKWKSLTRCTEKYRKTKVDGEMKDIVEQKDSSDYVQQNHTKVNQFWTLKVLYTTHFTVSIPIAYGAMCKTRKLHSVFY